MATPPSQQRKRKAKKQDRTVSQSPSITRLKGHQKWIPYPHCPQLLVPSGKVNNYPALESSSSDEIICSLLSSNVADNGILESHQLQPGGVVNSERKHLYARVSSIDNLDISEHRPLHSDSILLHPDTMRECEVVIASPVVISNFPDTAKSSKRVVCKVWPLAQLPLDVVALGNMSLESCDLREGDYVRIGKVQQPSQLPVAGEVLMEPCKKLDFPVSDSFQNYLLHMHNGHFICDSNLIGVQYYGEWRTFRVVQIHPLERELDLSSTSSIKHPPHHLDQEPPGIVHKLSELVLDDSSMEQSKENADSADSRLSLEEVPILKITAKSRMVVIDPSKTTPTKHKIDGPSLSTFAGATRQVKLLKELVLFPLMSTGHRGVQFPHGVLLYGPPGVGKSLLAQALANESSAAAHTVQLSAHELLLRGHQDGEGKLKEVFKEARDRCPSLLIIDDLHILCPHYDSGPSENERKLTASLCSQLDSLHGAPPPAHVVIIATTNQLDGVEPGLRRPGRFDKEVEIPVPTALDRREILEVLLGRVKNDLADEQLTQIADSAHGHVGADLYAVSLEAQYLAVRRLLDSKDGVDGDEGIGERGVATCCHGYEGVTVTFDDVRAALRAVRPSAMREVTVEVPKVYWSDIGGQEEVKERMKEAIEWPLKHPQVFSKLGISPPKGVLLYGPPGCSKTMVARALATESGLNFIVVKGPELFSKWVGDSERAVRQVFTRARAAAPAIIFFDEMDALAVQRKKEGGSSVADRVLAQLLTEMDGVESLRDVLVVAATNRPDMIDKALLRPGRIDRLIYVPLPSDSTRKEIFKIQFKKTPVADDVDVEVLATLTAGYSGAEIVSLCQEAALCAMHEDIQAERVTWKHFEQALKSVKPRTDMTMIQSYEQYNNVK